MTAPELITVLAVLASASVIQSATGFGFALLAMPLLSAVIGPTSALVITSLVSIPNSAATAITARAHTDRSTMRRQIVAVLVGMPVGLVLLESVSDRLMQLLIAATVATAAALLGMGLRLHHVGPRVEIAAGLLSGALSTSTGTSGPPLIICLQSRGMPARTLRATVSALFAATGWVSVVLLAARGHVDSEDVTVALVALPILVVTWTLGARWFARLSQHRYDALVVALLFGAAATAAWRAL